MFWVIWLATSVCKKFKFLWFFDPVPRLLLQCGPGSTSLVQTRFLNVTPPMMNQLTLAFLFLAQDFALCSTFKEIDSQNATVRGQMDAMRSQLEELGKAFHLKNPAVFLRKIQSFGSAWKVAYPGCSWGLRKVKSCLKSTCRYQYHINMYMYYYWAVIST